MARYRDADDDFDPENYGFDYSLEPDEEGKRQKYKGGELVQIQTVGGTEIFSEGTVDKKGRPTSFRGTSETGSKPLSSISDIESGNDDLSERSIEDLEKQDKKFKKDEDVSRVPKQSLSQELAGDIMCEHRSLRTMANLGEDKLVTCARCGAYGLTNVHNPGFKVLEVEDFKKLG